MHPLKPKDFSTDFFQFDFKPQTYFCIPRLQDSHIHLQGMGKFLGAKNLSSKTSLQEIKDTLLVLLKSSNSQAHIPTDGAQRVETLGYGVQRVEAFGLTLSENDLAELCNWAMGISNTVFTLILSDGHRALFTGDALKTFFSNTWNKEGLHVFKNSDQVITGILAGDRHRPQIEKSLQKKLHTFTQEHEDLQLETDFMTAQSLLLQQGVTHFRDMTSNPTQFHKLLQLSDDKKFLLYADLYFSNFKGENIDDIFQEIKTHQKSNSHKVQVKGVKIFLDGSLGGKNLDCSCHLLSPSPFSFSTDDILGLLLKAQALETEIAFHCIGDLAFEKIIAALLKLSSKSSLPPPVTHLEHCQFINENSLGLLQKLEHKNRLHFHFQPSHWLDDHKKLPPQAQHLHFFAWEKLTELGFANVFFGSDAPVVPVQSRLDQMQGLLPFMTQKKWLKPWWKYFSYPVAKKGLNTFTLFTPRTTTGSSLSATSNLPAEEPSSSSLIQVFIDGQAIKL